tara:strand:- start:680 stop:1084 length:405 start_codon:yes stop_codon:yes gene_type:complete
MKKIFLALFSIVFIFCFCLGFLSPKAILASDDKNDILIQKISKDYSKKFCNGIAFGLSKESAMKFAANENYMIFNKKILANDLNEKLIAKEIAISVLDGCGFRLELKGEEDIEEFQNQYISMKDLIVNNSMQNH